MRLFVGVPVPALDLAGTSIDRAEAHLTVAFLGEVDPGREAALLEAIEGAVEGITAFPLEFRGVGAFPSTAAPRVVWVGTADGSLAMIALARRVHERLRGANFPSEDRPLVPHVTLFRVRSAGDGVRARRVLAEGDDRRFGSTVVRSVTLWESQLRPTGAIHLPRRTWSLGEPRPWASGGGASRDGVPGRTAPGHRAAFRSRSGVLVGAERMSWLRQLRTRLVAWVLLGLLVAIALSALPSVAPADRAMSPPPAIPLATTNLSNCTGTVLTTNLSGALTVLGNASSTPALSGESFTYVFDYLSVVGVQGQPPVTTCVIGNTTFDTGPAGTFQFTVPIPADSCVGTTCSEYTGPYSTPYFEPAQADPAGYFFRWNATGSNATLEYIAALDEAAVTPSGPLTVSVDASTTFVAMGKAGDDQTTPVNTTVEWTLPTAGWAVTATGQPGSAHVVAAPGAGPATLTVEVKGTYNGTAVAAWSNLSLVALSTALTSASLSATRVDVGEAIGVTANGSGAGGYNYTAWVDPGLGGAEVPIPCQTGAGPGGSVVIACVGSAKYAAAGDAVPTVTLTNGYSPAATSLPSVTVNDAPFLSVAPLAVAGYVDQLIPVTISVAPGTGTPPFGPACVSGTGTATNCSAREGPTWSFDLQYGAPGDFPTTASLLDSAAENVSMEFPVQVASFPSIGAVTPTAPVVEAGSAIELSSLYLGGVLPAAYWWNLSAPGGTGATGELRADGAVNWSYVPLSAGSVTVSLTIVDSLGARVASSAVLTVLPGPASAIEETAWNASVIAGTSTAWSWFATDPGGGRVASFAAPLSLEISGPGASTVAVNATSLGTALSTRNDSVDVPVGAWLGGYLNLSLTIDRAGTYSVDVTGLAPPLAFAPHDVIDLACTADLAHVHVYDPEVALPGVRVNHTLWRISDEYGNPVVGGDVIVTESFDGSTWTLTTPILGGSTGSQAWVNYSAPAPDAGTVTVRTSWGIALLPPIHVPAVGGGEIANVDPLAWGGLGIAGVAGAAVWLVRRRSPDPSTSATLASDEELRRYAEGRERLLERIRADGPITLDALAQGGTDPGPTRAELGEWIASLLTERLIQSRFVPNGPLAYSARTDERPRIEFDESALTAPVEPDEDARHEP